MDIWIKDLALIRRDRERSEMDYSIKFDAMYTCAQLFQTLGGPMGWSLPDSSAHGILPGKTT